VAHKPFADDCVYPLAQVHAKWMESAQLLACFDSNFDPTDLDNGEVFKFSVFSCIANTQVWEPCKILYEKWLSREWEDSPKNLLMRALSKNQAGLSSEMSAAVKSMDDIIRESEAAAAGVPQQKEGEVQLKLGGFSIDKVKTLRTLFQRLRAPLVQALQRGGAGSEKDKAMQRFLDAQVARILGPAAKVTMDPANVSRKLIMLMGAQENGIAVPIEIGSSKAQAMSNALKALSPGWDPGGPNMERAERVLGQRIDILLRNHKVDLTGPINHKMFAVLPVETVEKLVAYQSNPMSFTTADIKILTQEIAAGIRIDTPENAKVTMQGKALVINWKSEADAYRKSIKDANLAAAIASRKRAKKWARRMRAGNSAISAVILYFTVSSFGSLREKVLAPYQSDLEQIEAVTRFHAATIGALAASTALIDGIASHAVVAKKFSKARSLHFHIGPFAKSFTKFTGAGAAGVGVVWDVKDAYQAYMDGEKSFAVAYGVSAGLGFASILLLLAGSAFTGVGLLVAVASLGLSFAIGYFKDDPYQYWLKRCYFGKGADGLGGKGLFDGESAEEREWNKARYQASGGGSSAEEGTEEEEVA